MNPLNEQSQGGPADASPHRADLSDSLTYEPFYGLREKPFSLSADPRFLFKSPAHGTAFDEIHAGIRRREGLIVLTGEIGTGKTTLCRAVLQRLDRRTFSAFVADPFVSREDLLKALLVGFGVTSMGDLARGRFHNASRSDLSYPLYEFLDSLVPLRAFAVVVIDEAQNLALPLLEEIRVLSELERREKLLQVVLVGQPELRLKLKLSALRQLEQRVSVRAELTALDAAGVAGYVRHRLAVAAAGTSRVEFTPAALEAVHAASSGVPRLINRTCDRALHQAFATRAMKVDVDCVRAALDDRGVRVPITAPRPVVRHEPPATITRRSADDASGDRPTAIQPLLDPALTTGLAQFAAESSTPDRRASAGQPRAGFRWRTLTVVTTAAAAVVIAASIGVPVWVTRQPAFDSGELAAMIPPPPGHAFWPAKLRLPAPPEAATAPSSADARRISASTNGYSILVASFQSRERAERVVEELAGAGFGAHAVEHSGPAGPIALVRINGYTSAMDAERDLQRIRELPGRFGDARIVEQD
jgi:general secretion pathway protein A